MWKGLTMAKRHDHSKKHLLPTNSHNTSGRGIATVVILVSTELLFALFWYLFPSLRPTLVPIGAALGTLFAAIAGFSDGLLVKLAPAVLAAVLVGLGAWFTTFDLEHQNKSLQNRLNYMKDAFLVYATDKNLDENQRSLLVRKLAKDDLRKRINDGEAAHVQDMADLILQISGANNGHGLYFSGEAWRIRGKREQMRGEFNKYLSVESHLSPEQRNGGPDDCYARLNGFCDERTAWVAHMMANDFYRNSLETRDHSAEAAALRATCSYIKDSLTHFPSGFAASTSFQATSAIQGKTRQRLSEMGLDQGTISRDFSGCSTQIRPA